MLPLAEAVSSSLSAFMYYPLHCFLAFVSIWWYHTCHQPFKVTAETDLFHGNYGFSNQVFFSGSWGCGLYMSLIYWNHICKWNICRFKFHYGSTTEYSCIYVLVLAAPIIDFTMEGSPHSAEKSMAVQPSRGVYVSVQYISSNHTRVHRVWVFLHCSCCNNFPWVVKDVLWSPDLQGDGGQYSFLVMLGHKWGKETTLAQALPLSHPASCPVYIFFF